MKPMTIAPAVALVLLLCVSGCGSTDSGLNTGEGGMAYQLADLAARASSTLSGIGGPDDARGANHALLDVEAELDDLIKRSSDQSPEAQKELAIAAADALPGLENLAVKAMSLPGVAEAIGPTMKSILDKMAGLV